MVHHITEIRIEGIESIIRQLEIKETNVSNDKKTYEAFMSLVTPEQNKDPNFKHVIREISIKIWDLHDELQEIQADIFEYSEEIVNLKEEM